MSDFFKSEMVRGDLQEMSDLQQYCIRAMTTFPALSPEKKQEYLGVLEQLIEKQHLFYVRLTLSDDSEAVQMLESLKLTIQMFGASPSNDINEMFNELREKIKFMRGKLEAEGA
jgi:hypothetical protein